ncbi:carboxypeptidase-like regulatory domain-containing protein [Singulisphaera sp. Ch08]|uniref:Carboxypeptidase-like regulatory domain-containing protein n=1 Tax=Singulisphaera sp. Ch08 TaxID=3120278 RepID=A0AAU7CEU3_9BACT
MSWVLRRSISLAFLGCGLIAMGCGSRDELPREPLSGTVTLAGKPVTSGSITFMPSDSNSPGTGATAQILDGAYDVPKVSGLIPGTYRVTISQIEEGSKQAAANAQPGDGDAPLMKELIPAKYNTKSTLQAEVVKDGKNVFDFSLDAK